MTRHAFSIDGNPSIAFYAGSQIRCGVAFASLDPNDGRLFPRLIEADFSRHPDGRPIESRSTSPKDHRCGDDDAVDWEVDNERRGVQVIRLPEQQTWLLAWRRNDYELAFAVQLGRFGWRLSKAVLSNDDRFPLDDSSPHTNVRLAALAPSDPLLLTQTIANVRRQQVGARPRAVLCFGRHRSVAVMILAIDDHSQVILQKCLDIDLGRRIAGADALWLTAKTGRNHRTLFNLTVQVWEGEPLQSRVGVAVYNFYASDRQARRAGPIDWSTTELPGIVPPCFEYLNQGESFVRVALGTQRDTP